MKYHIALKFLAVLLCTCFLLAAVAAGLGVVALAGSGLYTATVQELQLEQMHYKLYQQAEHLALTYLMEELDQMPQEHAQAYILGYYSPRLEGDEDLWYYTISDEAGKVVDQRYDPVKSLSAVKQSFAVTVRYPVVRDVYTIDRDTGEIRESHHSTEPTMAPAEASVPQETVPEMTMPPEIDGLYRETWRHHGDSVITEYVLDIHRGAAYTVNLYLLPGAYESEPAWAWHMLEMLYAHRFNLIALLGGALLLFAAMYVYLCCAAGRKPRSEELRPGGLNRIPLDLYAAAVGFAVVGLAWVCYELAVWHLDKFEPAWLLIAAIAGMAFVGCLLIVAFLFAFAAQVKMPGAWWLRHSVVGAAAVLCWKVLRWFFRGMGKGFRWLWEKTPAGARKGVSLVKQLFGGLWKIVLVLWATLGKLWAFAVKTVKAVFRLLGRCCAAVWRGLGRFARMLPLTWQWLLTAFGLMGVIAFVALPYQPTFVVLLGVGLCTAVVLYGAHCFGVLLESTRRMSKGDLDTKVDDKLLIGSYQDFAGHLNALADVAVEAARKQMKSERMKAELITNVSHDIKTPLTSIINYVDLMQRAESPEEAEEYLEVLSRQSQRMKKLLEDLMEMSKASTGNMHVELTRVDAVETVNQALGEFSEKLEQAQLTPVFQPPQEHVDMLADGKLAWRVLSNLLSNAVKYALPGTRLYVDLVRQDGQVLISLKNISREQLNVSSDELTERFVRGDASRNTEGSGLGLNIARSLMELQKGKLQLLVDGDLFKATLVFPAE